MIENIEQNMVLKSNLGEIKELNETNNQIVINELINLDYQI